MRGRRGTYSIVARDGATGQLGVAVQSHWFSVGSLVSWAEPGVGAVATQSMIEPAYGPRALELMRDDVGADDALLQLTAADELAAVRQVGLVDAGGGVGVHTGAECIPAAGDAGGPGFTCQANMMDRPGVPEAMAEVYAGASGPLADRLLAALDGAETAGGDVRGRQSAAILVVAGDPGLPAWQRLLDVRTDDCEDPLGELRRLVGLARAYERADEGDDLAAAGRHDEAARAYSEAAGLAPGNVELLFWSGLGLAGGESPEEGAERVRRAIELVPGFGRLLDRLSDDIAPSAVDVRRRLGR